MMPVNVAVLRFRSLIAGVCLGALGMGCGTTEPNVEEQVLPPGAVFKMISPNGGETFNYGDTITCTWLQNIKICPNGMLQVINGPNYCDYYSQSIPDRLLWPRDSMITTGYKYFMPVNDSTALAVVKVVLTDNQREFADCQTTFGGATNDAITKFRAYDEYKPTGCTNCYDDSDAPFTVAK